MPTSPSTGCARGAFDVASRLYGITFTELRDVPRWDPEVRAFEVKDRDGSHLAVFLVDYHPRPGKRSGAWASGLRGQWVKDGKDVRPIVTNTGNFTRPAGDAPALLSQEEVETLFHEASGTGSSPSSRSGATRGTARCRATSSISQIMENWAFQPEVLASYARHWKTGEPIPAALVEKIRKSARFDQGFKNTEYLAAAWLLDRNGTPLGGGRTRRGGPGTGRALAHGRPCNSFPCYRTTYFQHIFGPGAATWPATTATSGPRSWTPTPSRRSRRRGSSIRRPRAPSATCSRRGARSIPHGTLREVPGPGAFGGAPQAQARAGGDATSLSG